MSMLYDTSMRFLFGEQHPQLLPKWLLTYLFLVLLPQLLWILSNSSGVSVCESCSFLVNLPAAHAARDGVNQTNLSSNDHLITATNPLKEAISGAMDVAPEFHDPSVASLCSCGVDHRPQTRGRGRGEGETEGSYRDGWINNVTAGHVLDGGWHVPHTLPDLNGPCTIQRKNSSLSEEEFLEQSPRSQAFPAQAREASEEECYSSLTSCRAGLGTRLTELNCQLAELFVFRFAYREPVVLTGMPEQMLFRAHSTKLRLLLDYGHEVITVATANTNSYHKVRMTLCDYIDTAMRPQTLDSLGNETLYHFGDNDRESWSELFQLYLPPPYRLPEMEPVLSFGLAGPGTGVPFHIHGPTFAETIYGRKRWFLYPPTHQPMFHPDVSTLHWATYTLPSLPARERPLECTLGPGELLDEETLGMRLFHRVLVGGRRKTDVTHAILVMGAVFP